MLLFFCIVSVAVLISPHLAHAVTIYGSAYAGPGGAASLYSINPNTGVATLIGAIGFKQVGAIDFDASGTLYGVGNRTSDNIQVLLRINTTTGVGTEIGATTQSGFFQDISFRNSDNVLYGYSGGNIYTISTTTGVATLLGSTGDGFLAGHGTAFSPADTLYSADQNSLWNINQTTGSATIAIGLTYPDPAERASGMDFDKATGVLWASVVPGGSTSYLTTININTGTVTRIGVTQSGMDALAVVSTPTVTTSAASSVATSTATLNGSITGTGGANATQSGFAYGTVANLSTVIATSSLGAQTGLASFSQSLTGLTPNTTYYFRAYAVNSAGTSTGAILSTATLAVSAPTVTTQAASAVTQTTATGNGTITVTGNINPTTRGVVYGTSLAYGATTTSSGDFSTGAFTSSITSLTCNTLYHAAAYATNSQGVAYGSDVTFTTSACDAPASTATVVTYPNFSSGSASNQISNLLAMGFYTQAEAIAKQYGITIPLQPTNCPAGYSCVPTPNSQQLFTRSLKLGMTDVDVKRLQVFLNQHGFLIAQNGVGSPGHETTYFGLLTKAALSRFQWAHKKEILDLQGLTNPTGFFGFYTMKAVNGMVKELY